jgi:hypothetical protein
MAKRAQKKIISDNASISKNLLRNNAIGISSALLLHLVFARISIIAFIYNFLLPSFIIAITTFYISIHSNKSSAEYAFDLVYVYVSNILDFLFCCSIKSVFQTGLVGLWTYPIIRFL